MLMEAAVNLKPVTIRYLGDHDVAELARGKTELLASGFQGVAVLAGIKLSI